MQIGDFVRDKAGMGGTIRTLWYDWAGVEWNNGSSSWIEIRWLTKPKVVMC